MMKHVAFTIAILGATSMGLADDQSKQQSGSQGQSSGMQHSQMGQQGQTGQKSGMSGQMGQGQMSGQGAVSALMQAKNSDQRFLIEQASANQFEIQLSDLVSQKVNDDQIKRFAQQMQQDHRQAMQQLQQVAQQAGANVTTQLLPAHQALLMQFQAFPAEELGRHYMFHQVGNHQKNLLEYQYQAKNAQNQQLKQTAQQISSQLQEHLQMAADIARSEAAQTAGGRMNNTDNNSGTNRNTDANGTTGNRSNMDTDTDR